MQKHKKKGTGYTTQTENKKRARINYSLSITILNVNELNPQLKDTD
jgi:hypothetical protein